MIPQNCPSPGHLGSLVSTKSALSKTGRFLAMLRSSGWGSFHLFEFEGLINKYTIIRIGRSNVGKCTGPKWSKMVQTTILVKMTLFRTGFGTKMVHFGPFWPEEVHFGPFRSANRTLAIPNTRHVLANGEPEATKAMARF